MTMGDETPVTSLIMPVLIRPILSQLERRDIVASQTLRAALSKVEAVHPGFTYDFVVGIMRQGELSVNMNESMLRLQGAATDTDAVEYRLTRSEDAFQELNRKSAALKKILSRIPDEITDRKTFLETIKEIASAIKKLLDAVNDVAGFIPGPTGKQALEQRKREFVKFSKRFSNTLKDYFKEGHVNIFKGKIDFIQVSGRTCQIRHPLKSHFLNILLKDIILMKYSSFSEFEEFVRTINTMRQCCICKCAIPDTSDKYDNGHS